MKRLLIFLILLFSLISCCYTHTVLPTPEAKIVYLSDNAETCLTFQNIFSTTQEQGKYIVTLDFGVMENCPVSQLQYRFEFYDADNFKIDESSWLIFDKKVTNHQLLSIAGESHVEDVSDFVLLVR